MADSENLLLEAAGRTGASPRKRRSLQHIEGDVKVGIWFVEAILGKITLTMAAVIWGGSHRDLKSFCRRDLNLRRYTVIRAAWRVMKTMGARILGRENEEASQAPSTGRIQSSTCSADRAAAKDGALNKLRAKRLKQRGISSLTIKGSSDNCDFSLSGEITLLPVSITSFRVIAKLSRSKIKSSGVNTCEGLAQPMWNSCYESGRPAASQVHFTINGNNYNLGYYLADDIYPRWATFVKTIPRPQSQKSKFFTKTQESAWKDVEDAFRVLKARFAIIRDPARSWSQEKFGLIMRACMIFVEQDH
ncbi:hypothetical protein CRG98_039491 [Punica granatum]|uniref:Uncharacterized protein n=1 Tax=Punica granatum TaxID=22663 RepID=A0A2I0I7Y9_PUNGR|nr:hypothetical protein CRG98_039491 [Punica granatum]